MKKTVAWLLTAAILLAGALPIAVAEEQRLPGEQQEGYMRYAGEISEVIAVDDTVSILVAGEDKTSKIFHLGIDVLILEQATAEVIAADSVKKGQTATAFYLWNTPQTLSIPPQMTPLVIVIGEGVSQTEGVWYHADYFNDSGAGDSGELTIQLTEDVQAYDRSGNPVDSDKLLGRDLLVVYTKDGEGDSARAVPVKVFVLDDAAPAQPAHSYDSVRGTIGEVSAADGATRITVTDEYGSTIIFSVTEGVLVLDQKTGEPAEAGALVKDMTVEVSYHVSTPVASSLPPQMTPAVVLITRPDAVGQVKVDFFDSDGVSSDNTLKIMSTKGTQVLGANGGAIADTGVFGKSLAVLYTVSTRSIPAQTTPEKIYILDREPVTPEERAEALIAAMKPEHVTKLDEIKYVRLTDITDALGFRAVWDPNERGVTVMNGTEKVCVLKIGAAEYSAGESVGTFDGAPVIIDSKTYVEAAFVRFLAGQ